MANIAPAEFWRKGMEYAGFGNNAPFTERNLGTFKSHFGTTPGVCAFVWNAIAQHSAGAEFYHLLWALMFIKIYASEAVLKGKAGVQDEKTLTKWTWIVLRAIENNLLPLTVSELYL